MRGTDIKQLIVFKRIGLKIMFYDCPVCNRFFGTDEKNIETCCYECDLNYTIRDQQRAIERKNRLEMVMNSNKQRRTTVRLISRR